MDWLALYDKFQDKRTMNMVNTGLTILVILGFLFLGLVMKQGLSKMYNESVRLEPTIIHDTITITIVKPEPKRCFICKSPLTFNSDSLAACCNTGYLLRRNEVFKLESE